jgi:predicted PurR-regulated permease PerM
MANSQRILTARLDEAKIVLGQALLPVALEVVNLFNDKFLPVIENIAASFGGDEGLIQQIQNFISQAEEVLAPILEAIQNAFNRVSEAMEHNKDDIKAVTDLFKTMADFFVKYVVPIIKFQLVNAIDGIGIAFSTVLKIIGPVVSVISSVINTLLQLIDRAIQRINALIQAYNRISFLPNLPTISTSSGSTGSNTIPSSGMPFGGGSVGGSGSTGGGGGDAVTAAVAAAAAAAAVTSQAVSGLLPSGKAIPSNFNVGGFRSGEEADRPVTINVNAPSVIDEEGFSRAVQLALNNSSRRLGGGGDTLIL